MEKKSIIIKMKTTSIRIPAIWHVKIKMFCIENNVSMGQELKKAIQKHFNLY